MSGAVIGSKLLKRLPIVWLRWPFIAFILAVSLRMVLIAPVRGAGVRFSAAVGLGYVVLGLVMGIASGHLVSVGGIIAVPAMVAIFALSDLVAKGTSLIVIIPTSLVGTATNWHARTVDVRTGLAVGLGAAIGFRAPRESGACDVAPAVGNPVRHAHRRHRRPVNGQSSANGTKPPAPVVRRS